MTAWRVGWGALAVAATLAGCGSPGTTLLTVRRSGHVPGAALTLRVLDDGVVTCNGAEHRLPSRRLLDARDIERALAKPAHDGVSLPPGPASVFSFRVELAAGGAVSFADDSPSSPPAFARVQLFVRQVARQTCGLVR